MLSGISSALPSIGFSPLSSPRQAAALTLLAIAVLSKIPTASAGPVSYANCVAASGPWGTLLCLPLLLTPGP